MRRFRYRLQAALTRAEHEEQACQIDLARRLEEHRDALRRVDRVARVCADLRDRLRALHADDLDLPRVTALASDLRRFDTLLAAARSRALDLERAVDAARARLLEKARERRKLETHRDDLLLRHRKAELAAETKHLDEIAVTHSVTRDHLRPSHQSATPGENKSPLNSV